jgi:hypothetical protein
MSKLSTYNVEALHRVVAMLVAVAVLTWSVGAYTNAQAANLTQISNTLSDSDRGVLANHTIQFTIPTGSPGVVAGGTITVTFPTGFAMGSVAFGDMDLNIASSEQTLAAAPSGATWGATVSGQVVTFLSGSGTASAGDTVIIRIGTNAVTGGAGVNQVTNHATAGSYEFIVTAGAADSGRTRVAILDDVLVTAEVPTRFQFVVSGVATSTTINGEITTGSSTNVALPFGVLDPGTPKVMGQSLSVETNAANGFIVTVEQDGNLRSSTGADIDGFVNGSYTNTPTAWSAPTAVVTNENTWGHWGLTSNDSNLNANEFNVGTGGDRFVAASTTPRVVFSHNGPADGTTQDIGLASVAYKVQISALQEAGADYQTTLTYIATPTF